MSDFESESSFGFQRRRIFLMTFALTALLVFLLFPNHNLNPPITTRQTSFLTTGVESGGSSQNRKDQNSPSEKLLRNDSENLDDILKPPSQEWAQEQFQNALNMLNQTYKNPSTWQSCGYQTYYFPNIATLFTGIPKTGCSNWIEALLRANGDLSQQLDPTKVRRVHGGISGRHRITHIRGKVDPETLRKAFSFTVVRNPWTRMVSGFRDKLSEEKTQGGSFRGVGIGIVKQMRNITDREELRELYPTFTEFARWLVNHKGTGNSHFHQQYKTLCIPSVRYDFIVPLEYAGVLNQDVWGRINANTSLLGSYDKSSDPRLQKSALYAKEWLSKIDQETIDQLYQLFKVDFALMNYSNFTDPNFPLPLHHNIPDL